MYFVSILKCIQALYMSFFVLLLEEALQLVEIAKNRSILIIL